MFADKLFVDYEMVEDPYVTDIALSGGCYTPLTPARQGDIIYTMVTKAMRMRTSTGLFLVAKIN